MDLSQEQRLTLEKSINEIHYVNSLDNLKKLYDHLIRSIINATDEAKHSFEIFKFPR